MSEVAGRRKYVIFPTRAALRPKPNIDVLVKTAASALGHIRTIDPHKSPKFSVQYHIMPSKHRKSLAEIWKDQVQFVHAGFLNLFDRT